MFPAPLRRLAVAGIAAAVLATATLVPQPVHAQSEPAWSAPAGTEPCVAEHKLEQLLREDPGLAERRALFEALVREAQRNGLVPSRLQSTSAVSYVIPVVVHIVHQNGPENISDAQVKSQIHALNRDFANTPGNPSPAVNTGIQFCLATQLPPASTVTWSTTPGITRTFSSETFHTYGSLASETALKAIDYLPSGQYLNVWVVNNIAGGGGGVAGYATFPGTVPATLDGIVIRYTCFGSDNTPFGGPWPNLLPSNNDGKIMSHEVGHYLDLYHPFHGGCAPPGDQVADTPAEAVNRTGCPTTGLTSCTAANDPIENFMDYTNDACRFAFTAGQTTRMQTAIAYQRSALVSAQNLIDVGCPTGLNAVIATSRSQVCPGDAVSLTTSASGAGYTYAWSFPGGTPSSAATQNATVSYAAPGVYPATLTVTDGGSNSSTNAVSIYVRSCAPIAGPCRRWVFPQGAALDFGSGVPLPVSGTLVYTAEPSSAVSDAAGNLLFYTDGLVAYTATNVAMPNGSGLLAGTSAHNGTMAVKRPGSSTQYYLFTIRQAEDYLTPNPFNYSVVDMTLNAGLGDIPSGQKNLPIALPGSPDWMLEGIAAIPHCNGSDWWIVTHGAGTFSGKLYVTLVTSAGPVSSSVYNLGISVPNQPLGSLVASADGTRLAACHHTSNQIGAWNFDRATGAITTLLAPTTTWNGYSDIAFSPNGKLLYFNNYVGGVYSVRQLDIASAQVRDLFKGPHCGIRLGPDGLLYMAPGGSTRLHCVNFPDQFNALNLNECGFNPYSVPLPAGAGIPAFGTLTNNPNQCTTQQPAQFTFTPSGCLTVNFTSLNCAGPWSWQFGDASGGSGSSVSHTYAAPGTYTVTLTVTGAVPPTIQKTVTVGMLPVTIAGPATRCDTLSNYTAIGPAGYTYAWTTAGGTPAAGSGVTIDVAWPPSGGTLTLVATDPVSGCTSTVVKTVGPCPVCLPPPANMSAWFPLDEPTGSFAFENVLAANGADVGAPTHGVGKVLRARAFSGAGQYVQAADAPGLNFGAGDLTVDAWVRTTVATGIVPIVDKRIVDPETGYALYLKDGRLALRLGDGVLATGVEYWSATTPFVADGQWHHVAGVLRRSVPATGSRLFVDGAGVASFPAFSGGSVTSAAPLLIGAEAGFSGPVGYMNGDIDEVELFQRSLNVAEINGLYLADSKGKCKEFSYVPAVASFCRDQADVTLTMLVCNYSGTPQSYNLAFAGLPAGPGCTVAGPTSFTPLTPNPINVPANGCVPVQYKVARPAGMPLYATTCYQVTVTNTATSAATVNFGSVAAVKRLCNAVIGTDVGVGNTNTGSTLRFRATNTDDGPVTLPYSVRVASVPGQAGEPLVALNGLPPGVPLAGDFVLGPGESVELEVTAAFTEPREFRFFDVILSVDEDGDGMPDAEAACGLTYGPTSPALATPAPSAAAATMQLAVTPNPVRGTAGVRYVLPRRGEVSIGLYDVAGRQVRALEPFVAEAGPGSRTVDCRHLSGGVYFLRMRVNGVIAGQRFVVVR